MGVLAFPFVCGMVAWTKERSPSLSFALATYKWARELARWGQKSRRAVPVPSPATALERSGLEPQLGSTVELTVWHGRASPEGVSTGEVALKSVYCGTRCDTLHLLQ